jgi:hypothetical protein
VCFLDFLPSRFTGLAALSVAAVAGSATASSVRLAGLAAFLPAFPLGLAASSSAGIAGFTAFLAERLPGFAACLSALAVLRASLFAVFFAVEEAEPSDSLPAPPEDCPATGDKTINMKSRPAMQRNTSR